MGGVAGVERWWKRMTERGECDDEDCPDAFLCCKLEAGGQSRACQSLVAAACSLVELAAGHSEQGSSAGRDPAIGPGMVLQH